MDYVIITNEALKSVFQTLADWKTKKGIITQVRTVEWISANYSGCDLQEKIRNFIKDAYSYWGVGYVLLAGDTRIIPERRVAERKAEGWIPSDLYYSGVEGNWNANANYLFGELDIYGNNVDSADIFPDLAVGRASVETIEEANTFINKVLSYEKNPTTDYLTKMLFLAIWDKRLPVEWASQRWAELAQLSFEQGGTGFPEWFTKYELYAPVKFPDFPPYLWEGDSFLCKSRVVNAMNQGFHLIWHVDHCSQYSFGTGRDYNPDAQRLMFRNDVANLTNMTKPFILWTLGCDPNAFDYESISETFMNNPNGGAVAFMGNSVYGYFGNEWMGNYIFCSLFHYNIWNLGDAFRSVQGANNYYFGSYNQNLLGDPEMLVWDSIPKNLVVAHPDTFWLPESVFTVVVKDLAPGETAIVCVQKGTEAYAVGMVPNAESDTSVSFLYKPYTPGYMNITVTCHNYFVYEDSCYVPKYSGFAWLYPCSHFVFDDSLQTYGRVDGNKDGVLNPGEHIQVYFDIANSGAYTGYYVTAKLRSSDTLVSIIDSAVYYGNIAPGETAHKDTLTGGYFSLYLKPNYPDSALEYHRIPIEIFIEAYRDTTDKQGYGEDNNLSQNGTEVPTPRSRETFTVNRGPDNYSGAIHRTDGLLKQVQHDNVRGMIQNDREGNKGKEMSRHPQEWSYSLLLTEFCDSLTHSGQRISISNDTIFIYPEISNLGGGSARGVEVILRGAADIIDSIAYLGEVKSGIRKQDTLDPIVIYGVYSDLQLVMQDYYKREWTEPLFIDTIFPPDTLWAKSDEKAIDVNWQYLHISEPPSLAGYNIYRSLNETDPYERINPLLIRGVSYYRDVELDDWTKYFYKICGVDTLGNESDFSSAIAQRTQPRYQTGFPVNVEIGTYSFGFYLSSPAVADIDLDGKKEIAIGAQGRVYLFDDNGAIMPGWPIYLGNYWIWASPALVDLNNDDTLELVIATGRTWPESDSMVHCFNIHGNEMPGWPVPVGSSVHTSPVIADIDGDMENEILVATWNPSRLFAFEAQGSIIPGFPVDANTGEFFAQSPMVIDSDNDGKEEIFVLTRGMQTSLLLIEYNPNTNKIDTIPDWPVVLDADDKIWPTHSAVCDVDNNGSLNIIIALRNPASIRCYETDGTLAWWYPVPSATQIGGPGLGDINGDGFIDVIYTFNDEIYAVSGLGTLLWRKLLPLGGDWARASQGIVIADINNDSFSEILLSSFNWLWILNHDGSVMEGTPFKLEGEGHSTPAVADIDYDGDIEIIAASGGDCKLKVWDLPYQVGRMEWPMFQHDIKHTGRYYTPIRGYIIINNGADTTYSRNVTLTLHAESDSGQIVEMRIWDEINNTGWIPYKTDTTWTLISEDGTRRVYAEFRDNTGISVKASDKIYKKCIDASVVVNEGKELANFKLGLLEISVSGYEGNIDSIRYIENGDTTDWLEYTLDTFVKEFLPGEGKKIIGTQFKDNVGNLSIIYKDSVFLDTLHPEGVIYLPIATNIPEVVCTLSAYDALSGVDSFRLGNMPLNNIVPNGDFSDSAYWFLENTTIQDGYAALHGSLISTQPPTQIGAGMYQDLNPALFQNGISYCLSAELITHRVMDVSIGLIAHLVAGTDTTLLLSFLPQGNHIYTGALPFTDTFTFNVGEPIEYIRLFVSIPEIISPPWPPPETLYPTTVYINNLMITPVAPESIYSAWNPYDGPKTVLWKLLPGEGEKVVYAQYQDKCGNYYQTCDTTIFETVPPVGSVVIDQGVDTTNSSYVMLNLYAENGESGIDKMQVSNYPNYNPIINPGFSEGLNYWQQFTSGSATITLDNGRVTLNVPKGPPQEQYCYISQKIPSGYFVGKTDSLFALSLLYHKEHESALADSGGIKLYYHYTDGSESLFLNLNLPPAFNIPILYDTCFLFQPDPTRTLDYMLFQLSASATNRVSFTIDWVKLERSDSATPFTEWEPYDTLKAWQLLPENGTRWVYAWFKDYAGNISDITSDSIVVDTTKAPLAKVEINYNDKATDYYLVNLDFTYYSTVDSMTIWDSLKISGWLEPTPYQRWEFKTFNEGDKVVFAKFVDFTHNISTLWTDSIIFEQTPPYWMIGTGVIINDGNSATNDRNVMLRFNAEDVSSGVADVRITNEWNFVNNIIQDPWFDGLGYWQTDGKYARIQSGYAEIPAIHQQSCPNGEVAFIQQEISPELLLNWIEIYGLDSVWFTIAMDVVANDFSGNANLWIAYHYADGYSDLVHVLNYPQTNRVYWGRRRLSGSFLWNPDTTRVLDSLLIRIDIPVTYGPMPINKGNIWIDNIEIQPSLPDTVAIDWKPYEVTSPWKLLNQIGTRTVYAQFRDNAGNISFVAVDDIIYDNQPPIVYLNLPEYTNDTLVDGVIYSKDSLGFVDSMKFANFPYVNFVMNPEFNSDSNWTLDGQYAGIHNGCADIPSIHIPGPANPDTAFIEQFISADSVGAITGDTLSLSLDVITDSFVGKGTAKVTYCYSDGSFDESIDRTIKIPEGDSNYIESRRLSTQFGYAPDPSKMFTGYKIGVYIPITCESDSPPNSGRICVDNIILQKLPPDSLYCAWRWWKLPGADSLFLIDWPLIPGEGVRAVYARTMDGVGNISKVAWDKTIVDTTEPRTIILSPVDNSYLTSRDSLPIYGIAKDNRFVDYWLKYRALGATDWITVVPDSYSTTPVDSGLLGYCNTGALIGFYELCLIVTDSVQNIGADTVTLCFITPTETPPVIDAEFATFTSLPIDVATDALNFVYVTDTGDDKIWKFSETGDSLLAFGYHSSGGDTIGFNQPKGIVIDDSGFIWITDCLNHCVKKFDSLGNFKFKFGKHGNNYGEFNEPCGIAIDEGGFLWVCDNKNDRVQKFDRWGKFILQVPDNKGRIQEGLDGDAPVMGEFDEKVKEKLEIRGDTIELQKITGISILGEYVYITDTKHDRIVVFDTAGNFVKIIGKGAGLKRPWDNQVDSSGNLFVADVHNNRIVEFSPWGNLLLKFGVQGDSAGQFKLPHGLALSKDGKFLYVSDTYNNRVQKFLLRFESQGKEAGGVMAMCAALVNRFVLYQNHPNPFKDRTGITYWLGNNVKDVELKIYDISGRLVKTLVNGPQKAGQHKIYWNGKDEKGRFVSSGIYFYELKASNFCKTRKMILLR
ncbi:MAG: C25 family cysteine peptidase [candidate division WOR-3 bacterium]